MTNPNTAGLPENYDLKNSCLTCGFEENTPDASPAAYKRRVNIPAAPGAGKIY
jgi:hypothetical protein